MLEVSSSKNQPREGIETEIHKSIDSLINAGWILNKDDIISQWNLEVPYGYPTPFKGRDLVLKKIHNWLSKFNIQSRGRFGGWKYEVSNQDHSFMQGVEWVNDQITGEAESIYQWK